MLKIIRGRSGSGKTTQIYGEIKELIRKYGFNPNNKRIHLVVPDQSTLQTEELLIHFLNHDGLLNCQVMSFRKLLENIFDKFGSPAGKEIDKVGLTMLINRIYRKIDSKSSPFGQGIKRTSFSGVFLDLIMEFEQLGIDSEKLSKVNEFEEDLSLKLKINEIIIIFKEYEAALSQGYLNVDGIFDHAYRLITDKTNLIFEKQDIIYIDGFSGFTHHEFKIIEALLIAGVDVIIAISGEENQYAQDREVFRQADAAVASLRSIAERLDIGSEIIYTNTSSGRPDLLFLEKNLNVYPSNRFTGEAKNIIIKKFANPYEEIEAAAIYISKEVARANARFKDFSVVASIEQYGQIISRTFERFDIPFFIDDKRTVRSNLYVKTLESLIAVALFSLRHEDVFAVIKSGFMKMSIEEAEILENYCLQYGIKGHRWNRIFDDEKIEAIRIQFIDSFLKFSKDLKATKNVPEFIKVVDEMLITLNFKAVLDQTIARFEEENLDYARQYEQTLSIVDDVFAQAIEIFGMEPMSPRDIFEILKSGFGEFEIGIIPPSSDRVQIGSYVRSQFGRKSYLLALNMNDGVVPRVKSTSGILSNAEKLRLHEKGITFRSELSEVNHQEILEIYTILTSANSKLYLSHSISDAKGSAQNPSLILEKIREIFPKYNQEFDEAKYLINKRHIMDEFSKGSNVAKIHCISEMAKEDVLIANEVDQINQAKAYSGFVPTLDHALIQALFVESESTSITRLEQFGKCHFSHLVKYGLKANERKEFEIAAPDMGIIFHNVIEKISGSVLEQGDVIDQTKIERYIDESIKSMGNSAFLETSYGKHMIKRMKRVTVRAVSTLVKHNQQSRFKPIAFEVDFGKKNMTCKLPPLLIQKDETHKIFLEGRIDRIDSYEEENNLYVRVVDYKSGSKKMDLCEIYNGLSLQMFLYLQILIDHQFEIFKGKVTPAGVFYFMIKDPFVESESLDSEAIEKLIDQELVMDGIFLDDSHVINGMDVHIQENGKSNVVKAKLNKSGEPDSYTLALNQNDFEALLKHVKHIAGEFVGQMIDGSVKARPYQLGEYKACTYCSYSGICQFDPQLKGFDYNRLKKNSSKEIIELLRQVTDEKLDS